MRQTRTNRKHIKYFRLSDGGLEALDSLKEDLEPFYSKLEMKSSLSASMAILLEWYAKERVFLGDTQEFLDEIRDKKLY